MKNDSRTETVQLVKRAILIALIIVLQVLATALSRAAVLPFNITLTLIPIIIGAITFGPVTGLILGASFGVVTMVFGFTGYDPSCAVLIEENVFAFILLCILKGALAGLCAGLVAFPLKNHQYLAAFAAAVVTPVVNTGVFLIGIRLFYYDLMVAGANAGGMSFWYYMIIVIVGINFLIELGINLLFAPVDVRIIRESKKY